MKRFVYIDKETQNLLNLKQVGARLYAEHPSNKILCICFLPKGETPVRLIKMADLYESANWLNLPGVVRSVPEILELFTLALDPDVIFVAHNAAFEQAQWENEMVPLGFPPLPPNRWRCTMAKCYAMGLPGSLEGAAIAMKLIHQKDMTGKKVMQKLSSPRKVGKSNRAWWYKQFYTPDEVPGLFQKLYDYCADDVLTEQDLDLALPDLSPYEQRVWEIDQRANQQGMYVDRPLIETIVEFSERYMEGVIEDFRQATGDVVDSPTKRKQLLEWSKANGYKLLNTQAATIKATLARTDVPEIVRDALFILDGAGKASLAKFPAFLARSTPDGLLRETLQYHGAHTGRRTGRGVQVHNLMRQLKLAKSILLALQTLSYESFVYLFDDMAKSMSQTARNCIVAAPDCDLYMGDYGQIESRLLAWLAGEETKLQMFRDGVDVYCILAEALCGYPVTKEMIERQWGKVGDLSFGFGGGINAYAKMGRGYFIDFSQIVKPVWHSANDEERENSDYCAMLYYKRGHDDPVPKDVALALNVLKLRWRAQHPKTVQYWADLEAAAIKACLPPYPVVPCGKVTYFCHKQFLHCRLPIRGRLLSYPFPKVEVGARGKLTLTYRSEINGKWLRRTTWGGTLAENNDQAIERDIVVHAMMNLENNYPTLFDSHDELIGQRKKNTGGSLEEFLGIMRDIPSECADLPIIVEGYTSERYGYK